MLYDQLGVRFVSLEVALFPGDFERFPEGALSDLFGVLNHGETFDTCALRQRVGAVYEGEDQTVDVNAERMRIEFRSFTDFSELKDRAVQVLQEAQQVLHDHYGLHYLYVPKTVEVRALVPEDEKPVGPLIRAKLPKKLQQPNLPGEVRGAGIEFVGVTDDYHYTATIAPFLPDPTNLYLSVELTFLLSPEKLRESEPMELIAQHLQDGYDLCTQDLPTFAKTFLP